jgi:hypothetical protein
MSERPDPDDSLTVDHENGQRIVRWGGTDSAGARFVVEHKFPDAIRHHYKPGGVGEDVVLYSGPFRRGDDSDPFDGSVRWRWTDPPRVQAYGTRPTTTKALMDLMAAQQQASRWTDHSHLHIDMAGEAVPPQPTEDQPLTNVGQMITPRVEQQVGEGADLERVTFLIPNGWEAHDGHAACDPDDLTRYWYGRLNADGGGWSVTIDATGTMSLDDWHDLKDRGSYCFTHIGSLIRTDGTAFTGEAAFSVLDRLRVALNIALGRRTTCSLPVGWRGNTAIWARWRSAPVDGYSTIGHWLDASVASEQISRLIGRVLEFTEQPPAWEALRPAVAYYVAGNIDVDVELSVSVPVSGLQLLAYYRFVTDRQIYSNKKWGEKSTEQQLRLLLEGMNLDLSVPAHMSHLVGARSRLGSTGIARDALGVLVKMRNVVTHPTRQKPAEFSIYEWAEAGMLARYWLCLALFNLVGYDGKILDAMGPTPPWTGQLADPPWVTAAP